MGLFGKRAGIRKAAPVVDPCVPWGGGLIEFYGNLIGLRILVSNGAWAAGQEAGSVAMPDILLVQPPIRDFYLTAKRTIPYGLACIESALLESGFSVEILDCLATSKSRAIALPPEMAYLEPYCGKPDISPFALFHKFKHFGWSFDRIGEAAAKSKPFLVGISSLFTAYGEEALRTAAVVREFCPDCRIVVGGHHATAMPERVMECAAVDYAIRGDGEAAMPALAKALRMGGSLDDVPGIVQRKPGGGLRIAEPALMADLERYLPSDRSRFSTAYYGRKGKGAIVVVASRGCPLQCTYCCLGALSHAIYRRRSVEGVLREIARAAETREVGFIDFEDENISLDRNWFLKLLRAVGDLFGGTAPELRAMNGLLPTTLDDEVIHAMKEAGFKTLNLSLASTSPRQLKEFKRPNAVAAFDCALRSAERHGLDAVGYIIAASPGQSARDSLADLLFLASRRVLAGVSIYYPAPGSEDFAKCASAGILPEKLALMRSTAFPVSDVTSRDEAVTLLRLGRILNFMKAIADRGDDPWRDVETGRTQTPPDGSDRPGVGRYLLARFLLDGVIRGMTPDGRIFEHRCSTELTREFAQGLRETPIRGPLGRVHL